LVTLRPSPIFHDAKNKIKIYYHKPEAALEMKIYIKTVGVSRTIKKHLKINYLTINVQNR
jgi:hypothetical protein